MNRPLSVLVTGIGAPGMKGTLHCIKENPDKKPVHVVGTDMNASAVGSHFVDAFYPVPSPNSSEYLDKMVQVCLTEKVSLILPQTTKEIEVLSKNRNLFDAQGIRIMVSPYEALHIANNKGLLLNAFTALGLPTPHYQITETKDHFVEAIHKLGYPNKKVAIKPPVSNGMRGFRVLSSKSLSVEQFFTQKPDGSEMSLQQVLSIFEQAEKWPKMIVMEYLPGIEYSVDVFRGKDAFLSIPRSRDSIRSGISFTTTPIRHQKIEEISEKVANHLGLQYVFGLQFKEDEQGIPKILECNPRIQGTMVATVNTGINMIWLGVQEAMGNRVQSIPNPTYGIPFTRFWGGVIEVDGRKAII